jgi:purine-binding chemotaxis protein CheW
MPDAQVGNGNGHVAAPPDQPAAASTTRTLLQFEAGGGRFGLWIGVVRETIRAVAISPLPDAPPAVLGVINLRGRVIPVVDLRERFHLPMKPVEISDHMIIASAGARVFAFQVDRAVGLVEVMEQDIETARGVTAASAFLDCIVAMPDGLILIHDPALFLSLAEGSSLDAAMARLPA